MKKHFVAVAGAAVAACMAGAANADTRVSFATGLDYSSGDYGDTTDTEVISVPLSARITSGDWSFRASVPYLSITGPADVADTEGGGDGGDGSGGGTVIRTGTENGIGDTTLTVTRSFRRLGGSKAYFDLSGRVRLPTGDEDRGLGVGATDYSVLGEIGNSGDAGGVYLSAGHRFLGDPDGADRQDGWQGALGGWLRAGEKTRVGGSYWWREASFEGNKDPSGVSAYVSYRMSDNLRVALNAGAGLNEATADYSAGVRFTWRSEAINR